jgi:hypothetical protein
VEEITTTELWETCFSWRTGAILLCRWQFATSKKRLRHIRRGTLRPPKRLQPRSSRLETKMPGMGFSVGREHSLRYLDVGPIILALKFQASDFEYAHGWLHHIPSRHRFQFDPRGGVIVARRSWAGLSIKPKQAAELRSMFEAWRQTYWQPLETDQTSASHFVELNSWIRPFREARMAWRRFRQEADPVRIAATLLPSATPAE